MGILPKLPNAAKLTKSYQVDFRGLNHTVGAADSEIYDMKNLTSDHYPVLSPREKRKTLRTLSTPHAMLCYGEHMAWVDGSEFYYDGEIYGTVTAGEKTMAVLTNRIIIMPDKKYFDIRTAEAKGHYSTLDALKAAVTNPNQGDVYIIGTQEPSVGYLMLYYWNGTEFTYLGRSFGNVEESYTALVTFPRYGKLYGVKAEANTIQSDNVDWSEFFRVGDAVTISGCTEEPKNNKTVVIREIDGDTLYFYENVFTSKDSFDNLDLFFLDSNNLTKTVKLPPMSEEIQLYNDKILVNFESAGDKYKMVNLFRQTSIWGYKY